MHTSYSENDSTQAVLVLKGSHKPLTIHPCFQENCGNASATFIPEDNADPNSRSNLNLSGPGRIWGAGLQILQYPSNTEENGKNLALHFQIFLEA